MIDINYVKLGQKIRQRRKELHITQEFLAAKLDVNPSHISNIENARSYPSLTALFTISSVLECGLDYFLCDQYSFNSSSEETPIDKKLQNCLKHCSEEQKEKLLKIAQIIC